MAAHRPGAALSAHASNQRFDRMTHALVATLTAAALQTLCCSPAVADSLRVAPVCGPSPQSPASQPSAGRCSYLTANGEVTATVTASGPAQTAISVALARGSCPSQFDPEGVQPGVTADGQPHVLVANAPQAPEFGRFALCVWTIDPDQHVGARYKAQIMVPAPADSHSNPAAGTNHPLWWLPLGDGVSVFVLVVVVLVGYGLHRLLRRLRRRLHARSGGDPVSADGRESLGAWQQAAAAAAVSPAGFADQPTASMDASPAAHEGFTGGPALHFIDPSTSTGEHPFVPPPPDPAASADANATGAEAPTPGDHLDPGAPVTDPSERPDVACPPATDAPEAGHEAQREPPEQRSEELGGEIDDGEDPGSQ